MADDPLSAALAEIRDLVKARDALVDRMRTTAVGVVEFNAAQDRLADRVPRLLAVLDAVLAPHSPRMDTLLGRSCITHRTLTLAPVPGCGACTPDQRREVCQECRDPYGDPVPFGDCRARKAALGELARKGDGSA